MSTSGINHSLVSLTDPASFAAEQYHGLGLKVERLRLSRDVRVIAVTSPGIGDGKTITSINLAAALVRGSDARALLIDADLRRPAVPRHLGLTDAAGPGLAELILDSSLTLASVVRSIDFEDVKLAFVPAGANQAPVHKVLRSPRIEEILKHARADYDYIVLDTPPLVPVFDSSVLSRAVDGMLLVVAANKTPRKLCEEALNNLDPSKVLGIVFNGDERPLGAYYRGYYERYFVGASSSMRELRSWLP